MAKRIESVDLPLAVALRIVTQGLRIRLGRSMVTLSGVLLGIMFLSSTVTTHLIKGGVSEEDQVRAEVNRMANFLEAEIGPLEARTVAIRAAGDVSEAELRLPAAFLRRGAEAVHWEGEAPSALRTGRGLHLGAPAGEPDVYLLAGEESLGRESLEAAAGPVPAALTRAARGEVPAVGGARFFSLSGQLSAEEEARAEAEGRTARYRLYWIVAIALAVTMIGITNAMLMSVTERFREIGTMKCLGATRRLVRRIFIIESLILGGGGGIGGALCGAAFSLLFHGFVYGFALVFLSLNYAALAGLLLLAAAAGVALTILAALYPASIASSMLPSDALRSNV